MADLTLTLGGVEFADFEIPEEIAAGGGQLLQIHKFAGGARTIDTFGADDDAIAWSGIFFDDTAEARCQQIDAMRRAGAPLTLSWSSFSYLVVIKTFKFRFQRFYQISYEIELEVAQDNTQPATADLDDPETDIQDDIDDAADFSQDINDSGLTSLMAGISSSVNSVSSIVGAPTSFLDPFLGQIDSTLSYVDGLSDQADAAITGLQSIASGGNPLSIAQSLIDAGGETGAMAETFAMTHTLGRLARNVEAITG